VQLLVTVAAAGRRIRQLRSTTLATQAALQRVATFADKLLFLTSAAFQYVPSVASFCYSQQVHHCTRRTSGSPCQQRAEPRKVRSQTTSGVVTPAFMAGIVRLALLLAVFAAAVALSSGQPTADEGELVQGASCARLGASRPRMLA
jgi:hypothetical protein